MTIRAILAKTRQEHLHLRGRVFCASSRMIERVAQRAAAHEGQRRDLDDAGRHPRSTFSAGITS